MMLTRMKEILLKLRALAGREQLDRELNDELAFHLAMREQKNAAEGMPRDESRYAADVSLGTPWRFGMNERRTQRPPAMLVA
jgi:hypothetical protein